MLTQKIEKTIQEINKVENSEENIFGILKNICDRFCIKLFSLSIFYGEEKITESFFLYSTCSLKWEQHYKENRYYLCDPSFNSLQKVAFPFEWYTENFKILFPLQQELMKEAEAFGIRSGITIPLLPHSTFHGFFTIFNQSSLHPDIVYILSLVANVCTDKIMEIKKGKVLKNLTEREKEILSQRSRGLSVKSIGHNLNISESAVAFHLTNIRKKLNAQTTEHAVAKFLTHTNLSIRPRTDK